jgi:hypothetical protein
LSQAVVVAVLEAVAVLADYEAQLQRLVAVAHWNLRYRLLQV